MQHLEDIITMARINTEERERKAAQRRLSHEATLGQPSLLQRLRRFRGRSRPAVDHHAEPGPQHDLEVVPNHP